jgi:hypothetical protein
VKLTDDERDAAIQDIQRLLKAVVANTQEIPGIKDKLADFEVQLEAGGSELAKMVQEDFMILRSELGGKLTGVDRNVQALNDTVAGHVTDYSRHVA